MHSRMHLSKDACTRDDKIKIHMSINGSYKRNIVHSNFCSSHQVYGCYTAASSDVRVSDFTADDDSKNADEKNTK